MTADTTPDMFHSLDRAQDNPTPASAATESETPTVEPTSAVEMEDQAASGTSDPAPVTAEPDSASSSGDDTFGIDTAPGLGPETAAGIPETADGRVFSGLDELFAPTDWGDVLRLANFASSNIGLVHDQEGHWVLLLRDQATGMWRLPDTPGFRGSDQVQI